MELTVILKHRSSFITLENNDYKLTSDITSVEYEQLTIDKLDDPLATEDMLDDFATNPKYANTKVYLVSIYVYPHTYVLQIFGMHYKLYCK